jgi:cytochrome c-type biogenesis protein CcmF
MKTSKELQLSRGQSATVGKYTVTFTGAEERTEPNRQASIANFDISRDGKRVATMAPRMNPYLAMREPVGTPDVHSTLTGDLYLSIMRVDPGLQQVGVLAIITPMVGWIWISVILMGIGGLIGLIPARQLGSRLTAASATLAPGLPGIGVPAVAEMKDRP